MSTEFCRRTTVLGLSSAAFGAAVVSADRAVAAIAAELTNHLIDGVVLTPGIGGTIPELQQAGFHYAA